MKLFGIPYKPRQAWYVAGDLVALPLAVLVAHLQRFGASHDAHPSTIIADDGLPALFFLVTSLVVLYIADAYNPTVDYRRPSQHLRLWGAVGVGFLLQVVAFFFAPDEWWGRGIAALVSLDLALCLSFWRGVAWRTTRTNAFRVRTLIVGDGDPAHFFANTVLENPVYRESYEVVGAVEYPRFGHRRVGDGQPPPVETPLHPDCPRLGKVADLDTIVAHHDVDLIVVAIRGSPSGTLTQRLLVYKARGIQIEEMPTLYKRLTGQVPILHAPHTWVIFGPVFSGTNPVGVGLERTADVFISAIGLLLTAPIIAVAGLAVRLESPGPAFFLQERLGRNEVPFRIVKLRTMRNDAEAKTGAVWSLGATDPRVTRVGRFLRRTRIDELPQFWNVLRGDMAIVGPRPEREHFVKQLKEIIPFYALRFSVKPGVTGWAQVNFRYAASEKEAAEKLCYELFAIQEMSPVLYVLVLLKTVQTMLFKPGS